MAKAATKKRKKSREAGDPVAEVLKEYVASHPHLQSAMERRQREGTSQEQFAKEVLSAFRGD